MKQFIFICKDDGKSSDYLLLLLLYLFVNDF